MPPDTVVSEENSGRPGYTLGEAVHCVDTDFLFGRLQSGATSACIAGFGYSRSRMPDTMLPRRVLAEVRHESGVKIG
jgi:hypothetical protein